MLYFRVTTLLGYQPQELLGKSAYDFYHPEDQELMKESFEQGILSPLNNYFHINHETKGFFQFDIIITIMVSSFSFI